MVTAVLCAAFDAEADAQIMAVRTGLRTAGADRPGNAAHRPHLSLVAAQVATPAEVLAVAAEVAGRQRAFDVVLGAVGRFDRAGALWLRPHPEPALTALHADAVDALAAAGFDSAFGERSSPGQWIAHCTLATRLPRGQLREMQQRLAEDFRPITARVEAVATILVGGRGDAGWAALQP